MPETTLIKSTQSLCPICLRQLDGAIIARHGAIHLNKTCPEHGPMTSRIWPDVDHYQWMESFRVSQAAPKVMGSSVSGCPRDCGLCAHHLKKPTLVEIETTQRCNLHCPVCFMAAAGGGISDPSLEKLQSIYKSILDHVGPQVSIQLTGGEPTLRNDLDQIVRLGRHTGFSAIEVNTNGIAIARQGDLLHGLVEAGITGIYLQFDGMTSEVCTQIRGADLLAEKLLAIERCREAGAQVVLAMTVVGGINHDQIGAVLDFAMQNSDVVAGIALQPAFFSGRFEANRQHPLTMGDVIFLLAEQSHGLIEPHDLWPLGCSHPLCSAATYLVRDGENIYPLTRRISPHEYVNSYNQDSPQGSVFADLMAQRSEFTGDGLSVVIMNYMDAWTVDLTRLRECSMTVETVDGRAIPFCAYHLTDVNGKRIYTPWGQVPAQLSRPGYTTAVAG